MEDYRNLILSSTRNLITAFNQLYPEGLTYISSNNMIEDFNSVDAFCKSCGSYIRPLSFLAHHIDHPVDLCL
ncbi:Patatin-like serine hydrolase [Penicillium brevicompactum]|uniref:Patatin-like serine hydrolase n=1 Tax=Penicillium brevicompactum TaxID=5074 RepID=UPI00254195FF|nr:Patatin-like serine hydrolase [Penicillium brevicompactum]KAJ5336229.1 Patatin-like serine hydrolase [Penicillium brevicompactum]